jgi:hypothetical protein
MATTPQQFFSKNMKWVLLVVSILFVVKSVQSCNRNMVITAKNNEIIHLNDSLSTTYGTEKETLLLQLRECEKENTELEYEVKLANAGKESANKRADAVQSTAEKTRSNTTSTIVVKGAEEVVDSTEVKK